MPEHELWCFELGTGGHGCSYERCYVIAKSAVDAIQFAKKKHLQRVAEFFVVRKLRCFEGEVTELSDDGMECVAH